MSEFAKCIRRFRERYVNGRHRKDSRAPAGFRAGAGYGAGAGCPGAGSGACTCLTGQPGGYVPWGMGAVPPAGSPAALSSGLVQHLPPPPRYDPPPGRDGLKAAMNYIMNTYLPRQNRYQAQMDLYQRARGGFYGQVSLPVPQAPAAPLVPAPGYLAQGQQAVTVRNGQSFLLAFWDELAGPAGQDGWDLVLDGGSRLPFPAAVTVDPGPSYSGATQIRLVSQARGGGKSNLMHNFVQGLVQSPPCTCLRCQPGGPAAISSGSGYTSGGRPVQVRAGGCQRCRYSPCRCPAAARQRPFSNKGIPGFDGRTLADLAAGLEAGELPDVAGVLRGYRWWSLAAPDLSKSPAHADDNWPRSPLRGMRDVWNDGENLARCLTGPQKYHEDAEVPHSDCSCGFWAYWTLQVHDIGAGQLPVCGVVEGYGATVIGELGFRAAKARIVGLHLPFTIQPAGDPDPDPLGLGLPPVSRPGQGNGSPASPHNPGGTVYGRGNPWYNHPKFTGRVLNAPGYPAQPDPDLDGLARPAAAPGLDRTSAAGRQSNRDRAEAWLAVIGDRLAQVYPSAKIFETRAAMEAEFPPDLSYVP